MHDGMLPAFVKSVCYVNTSCTTRIQGLTVMNRLLSTRQMQFEALGWSIIALNSDCFLYHHCNIDTSLQALQIQGCNFAGTLLFSR